jgi:hypothetical protein
MLVLAERWTERLVSQPETGMRYQIVSIRLSDEEIAQIGCLERIKPDQFSG